MAFLLFQVPQYHLLNHAQTHAGEKSEDYRTTGNLASVHTFNRWPEPADTQHNKPHGGIRASKSLHSLLVRQKWVRFWSGVEGPVGECLRGPEAPPSPRRVSSTTSHFPAGGLLFPSAVSEMAA